MKKLGVLFVLGLILLAVLFSAGCVKTIEETSSLDIIVTKDGGTTYCVGDTMTVNLPNYSLDGYSWKVTYSDGIDFQEKKLTPEELGLDYFYDSYSSFIFSPNKEGEKLGVSSFVLKFMEGDDESSAKYVYNDSMKLSNGGEHATSTFTYNGEMIPKRGKNVSIIYQKSENEQDYVYKTDSKLMTEGLTLKKTEDILPGELYGGEYGATKWTVTSNEIGTYYFGVKEYSPDGDEICVKFYLSITFDK